MKFNEPIVVLGGARTPVGSFGGQLAGVPAHELGAHAVKAALQRSGVDVEKIDEFVVGNVGSTGNDAYISRRVALTAGARIDSTALTVNRLCGSSMQAVASAAMELTCGESAYAVAAGCENMSAQPFLDFGARKGYALGNRQLVDGTNILVTDPFSQNPMGWTAERVAEKYGATREEQDEFAVESQRRAQEAIAAGAMKKEIEPLTIKTRKGDVVVDTDEHPRAGVTMEKLAGMKPVFLKENGTVTAGNASGINDGGAALVLTTASQAEKDGLKPLVEIVDFTKVGIEPEFMGYAPKLAIEKILKRTGLTLDQIGWIELNEAFAAQSVPIIKDLGLDPAKTNPLGGAIAWGHPIGATGAIICNRAIQNQVEKGLEYSMASMCIGGGQATAIIFKLVK